jgi:hypothetical protein
MDLEDNETKAFIQAIFNGKGREVVKTVLKEKISLPLEVIKLGIEHHRMKFFYDRTLKIKRMQGRNEHFHSIDPNWMQSLAYSGDDGVEAYVNELFLKFPELKAIALLTLSAINPQKAVYWLKIIKEFDPLFSNLKLPGSPLVDDLCQKYECIAKDLFNTIIFSNEESSDEEKIEKRLHTLMKTKANTPDVDELKLAREERRRILASGKLSPSQADRIFSALWRVNVVENETTEQGDFLQRDPLTFFRTSDSGRHIENDSEVKDLITILPYISNKKLDKVILLFDLLPIWDKKYKNVSECLYRFDKNYFCQGWERLLREEAKSKPNEINQVTNARSASRRRGYRRTKTMDYNPALEVLEIMHSDKYQGLKGLLLELIEHPSPLIREKVKELLSK